MNENLSAVLKCKGQLLLENRSIPVPSSNEVLLAIQYVGICGSDIHYWKNGCIGNFIVKDPLVLGHESSGVVLKVGADVKTLKPGDRVCIEPGVPCRTCEFCKKGRYNLCPTIKFDATPPVDGSLCRYYTHPADFCHKLPDNVSLEEGALMEPLSVAVHACRRAFITAGSSVLICGAGPIGLLNLLACKAMGASKICITDICERRLEVAKNIGATYQICVRDRKNDDIAEEIKSKIENGPDSTIDCCGAESTIRLGIQATKPGGTVVVVGCGPPEVKLPLLEASIREIDIRGLFRYANCYPTSLSLVANGSVNVRPLISHYFKLEEAVKAFETAHTNKEEVIKVLIKCKE